MAGETIVQNMITRLGQSQDERRPAELDAHFADVDERTSSDLLEFAQRFAAFVRYYDKTTNTASGDWTPFFELPSGDDLASILTATGGDVPPHLALLAAFVELYQVPRDTINLITGRHLDFFYEQVLGFVAAGPSADHAHVLLELKKGASPIAVTTSHVFTAGKDDAGVERLYVPARETVVGQAAVASLRSVFVDDSGDIVRFAPIANSSDGLGGELEGDEPKWRPFGTSALPEASIGFAIASPVLRMAEGDRTITLTLTFESLDADTLTDETLSDAFEAHVTGAEGWLGPYAVTASVAGEVVTIACVIPSGDAAVTDYDAALHAHAFTADAPVMQLLLVPGMDPGYAALKELRLTAAQCTVSVNGLTALTIENDAGTLDPKKTFLPFGSQPASGSRLMIGSTEALSKTLSALTVDIEWHGAPEDFSTHYGAYDEGITGSSFTASGSFVDGAGNAFSGKKLPLFESGGPTATGALAFSRGTTKTTSATKTRVQALQTVGTRWSLKAAAREALIRPTSRAASVTPEARTGFIVISLDRGFLHAEYRKKSVEYVLNAVTAATPPDPITVLEEPYTPAIRAISISYTASSGEADLASATSDAFASADLEFFHVGCFGQMREHAYQRSQFDFVGDTTVPLLPAYDASGELCIGLTGVEAGDSVSLLFQVAEGSADPDVEAPGITWSVLCDNYWKALGTAEVAHDTTDALLTSGTIAFTIPSEATTTNTLMPSGCLWLRGAVVRDAEAASQLIDVHANAVEVVLQDPAAVSESHLTQALAAESIARLKTPIATIKSIAQPYASFDGAPAETDDALRTRAAERLRHRNRAVTAWDYERLVLNAFPRVHRVKCIPHATTGNWLAPGHVLLVVVPDLRNQNAVDPLAPKVDAATISEIADYLRARSGMGVQLTVANPAYQKVHLDVKVQFKSGYEFNYYSGQLQTEVMRFLSPWAFDTGRSMTFGGKVYKSVLLDVVEELAYVDYVTEVKLYTVSEDGTRGTDADAVSADTPDAILVSDASHTIAEVG